MAKILRLCEECRIERLSHSERSLELMLPSALVARTVTILHHEFFGE